METMETRWRYRVVEESIAKVQKIEEEVKETHRERVQHIRRDEKQKEEEGETRNSKHTVKRGKRKTRNLVSRRIVGQERKTKKNERRINVSVTRGGGRNADSFSIAFRGKDPEKVIDWRGSGNPDDHAAHVSLKAINIGGINSMILFEESPTIPVNRIFT